MTLTKRERKQIVRLLGLLQGHLESAIESSLVPGTNEPDPAIAADVENVRLDRRDWKRAEAWVKKLEASTLG